MHWAFSNDLSGRTERQQRKRCEEKTGRSSSWQQGLMSAAMVRMCTTELRSSCIPQHALTHSGGTHPNTPSHTTPPTRPPLGPGVRTAGEAPPHSHSALINNQESIQCQPTGTQCFCTIWLIRMSLWNSFGKWFEVLSKDIQVLFSHNNVL